MTAILATVAVGLIVEVVKLAEPQPVAKPARPSNRRRLGFDRLEGR